MERYLNPKRAAGIHFYYLKTALKIEKKSKNTKNCQYPQNGWKYRKFHKISANYIKVFTKE